MKRKNFILLLSLMMALSIFLIGCGEKTENAEPNGKDAKEITSGSEKNVSGGETYDVGKFSVYIPEGWFAHPMFMNEEKRDNQVNVVKGTDDPMEAFDAPLLTLTYGSANSTIGYVDKEFYDDPEAKDLEPLKIGAKTFKGYTANSAGYDMIYLFAEDGDEQYQISMFYNQPNGKISLEDDDVIAIIESFKSI